MKKWMIPVLALVLLLSLTACGVEKELADPQQQITLGADVTMATKDENAADATVGTVIEPEKPTYSSPIVENGVFALTYEGVQIVPAEAFDATAMPEALSVFQVPSCALEGTDNLYNYGALEVTAFDEGKGEFVYSIYFLDPNLTTDEGLALGDDAAKAMELYGDGYAEVGGEYIYTRSNTQLRLIVEGGTVVSIEYRMVTDN